MSRINGIQIQDQGVSGINGIQIQDQEVSGINGIQIQEQGVSGIYGIQIQDQEAVRDLWDSDSGPGGCLRLMGFRFICMPRKSCETISLNLITL